MTWSKDRLIFYTQEWSCTSHQVAHFHYVILSCANYFFVYFLPKCNTHTNRNVRTANIEICNYNCSLCNYGSVGQPSASDTQAWRLSLSKRKVGSESVLELDNCTSVKLHQTGVNPLPLDRSFWVCYPGNKYYTLHRCKNRNTLKYHTQLDPNASRYRNIIALNQADRTS